MKKIELLPSVGDLISEGWRWYHDDCSLYFHGTDGFIDCSLIKYLGEYTTLVPYDILLNIRLGIWKAKLPYGSPPAKVVLTLEGYYFRCELLTSDEFDETSLETGYCVSSKSDTPL